MTRPTMLAGSLSFRRHLVSAGAVNSSLRLKGPAGGGMNGAVSAQPASSLLMTGGASAYAERHEAQVALPVHQQQHRLAVGVAGGLDLGRHVLRRGNLLLRDLDDHVAGPQALLGGG